MIDELERIDDLAALLTEETPELVWDALVEVRDEMSPQVREVVGARASAAGRDSVVAAFATVGDSTAKPAVKRTRSKPAR